MMMRIDMGKQIFAHTADIQLLDAVTSESLLKNFPIMLPGYLCFQDPLTINALIIIDWQFLSGNKIFPDEW